MRLVGVGRMGLLAAAMTGLIAAEPIRPHEAIQRRSASRSSPPADDEHETRQRKRWLQRQARKQQRRRK